MAFQTGTRVNPQLGALDFSGFTNAANIQGETLAQLGQAMGSAIEKHQEKKIKKQQDAVTRKALGSLFPDLDDDTLTAIMKDEVFRDLFKSTLDNDTIKPSSPGAMGSAETYAATLGFDYNPETRTMQKTEGPGFLRSLGNILTPGQPFGSPQTIDMPQEIIEGTTGMQQFIQQQQALTGDNQVPELNDNDPMGIF